MSDVGDDRPTAGTEIQLTPLRKGVSLTGSVESAQGATLVGSTLVVRPDAPELAEAWAIDAGDRVEVFWRVHGTGLAVPTTVVAVLPGDDACWELRVTGPAEPSQRRQAVRAGVRLPIRVHVAGTDTVGETADLSEAGCRVLVDGWGLPPEPGLPAEIALDLEDGELIAPARVVRVLVRGARWWISLELRNPSEQTRDRLRRRVFGQLRAERARLADADD
jgi:hypothetical protein